MSKRSKEDKQRIKRKKAAQKRRERNKEQAAAFFKVVGSFPLDMRQEVQRVINKHPFSNRDWKNWSTRDGIFMDLLNAMVQTSANYEAFSKYFPRYSLGWAIQDNQCIFWPFETERVIEDQVYYKMPEEIKLPLSGGHPIVFTKHAMERIVQRYGEESMNVTLNAPQMSLYYPIILYDLRRVEFEVTYLDGEPYLHSYGYLNEKQQKYYGRGHFPIVYKNNLAVAKTFLYDKWLGSTIEN